MGQEPNMGQAPRYDANNPRVQAKHLGRQADKLGMADVGLKSTKEDYTEAPWYTARPHLPENFFRLGLGNLLDEVKTTGKTIAKRKTQIQAMNSFRSKESVKVCAERKTKDDPPRHRDPAE